MEDLGQRDLEDLVLRYVASPRPELKDLIMVEYTGLVERVARRYAGIEPVADLIQVGFIGLLNALSKFDPTSGVKFGTYAQHLITGEIKHYLRDRTQTIRQPAWLQELRHKVNRASGAMLNSSGRAPSPGEIAAELGVTESAVRDVLDTQEMLKLASLDATPEEDGGADLDRMDSELTHEHTGVEDRLMLESAMGQLRDLERQVLTQFHFNSLSQAEIAQKCSISPNYVSHILRQSLAKLRRILEEDEAKEQVLRRDGIDADVFDRATGAYSETYFRTRLGEELHRAAGSDVEVGLLIIELPACAGMRPFGSPAAASLLTDLSEILRSNVRRLDLVGRFGELGFGIVLPYVGMNVNAVRDRLASKLEAWARQSPRATGLSFAFGEATSSRDGRTSEELISAAVSRLVELEIA